MAADFEHDFRNEIIQMQIVTDRKSRTHKLRFSGHTSVQIILSEGQFEALAASFADVPVSMDKYEGVGRVFSDAS